MSKSNRDGDPPKYTPEMIRQIRKYELGFDSMEAFADRIGWSRATVQRYESGDSPIKAQFIRDFEKLRADMRTQRVQAENARRIDLDSASLRPGLALLELLPIRRVAGTLFRMFIAVPKDLLSSDAEVEQQPSLAPTSAGGSSGGNAPRAGSGMASNPAGPAQTVPLFLANGLLPEGTVLVENVLSVAVETSERPTRSFSAVQGIVPPPEAKRGQRMAAAQPIHAPSTSKQSHRFISSLAMAACLGCWVLVTGCLLSHRAPDEQTAQEPDQFPERLYADNATDGKGAMGTQPKRSIKMPNKPYAWQKVAPCDQGEVEKVGGCWAEMKNPAPCPRVAVEENGKCYVPIPAEPTKPNTVDPER